MRIIVRRIKRNPKLRLHVALKVERLEKKIRALIAAEVAYYDAQHAPAGVSERKHVAVCPPSGRKTKQGHLDRRTRAFKQRHAPAGSDAAAALASPHQPAPGDPDFFESDWELEPEYDVDVGATLSLPWRLQRALEYFNPASWRVDGADGSVSVTRLQRPVDSAPAPE